MEVTEEEFRCPAKARALLELLIEFVQRKNFPASYDQWQGQLPEEIRTSVRVFLVGWLVLDTFFGVAGLGGEEENKAGVAEAAVAPLRLMVDRHNLACTLSRHERKSGGAIGESGRGSSALTGAVDVIVQLRRLSANYGLNVRQLEVSGRVEQARLLIELVNDKYIAHDAGEDVRLSSAERDGLIVKAVRANSQASLREIGKSLGMDYHTVGRRLKKLGWFFGKSGWAQEED